MRAKPLPVLKWSVTFAAMFSAGAIGFALPSVGAHPTLPLFGTGIAVAACIRWGRRMWPSVLAAGAGIDLWTHLPFVASLGVGLGATGCAVFTTWFLDRRGFDAGFGRARDVPLFILAVCLGTMIVPTLGLIGFRLAGDATAFMDPLRWIRWWSNTTAGVLMVGPILVALSRQSLAAFAEHWAQGGFWLLAVALCCAGTLTLDAGGVARPLIVMLALLLVVVGAIHFGLVVAAFGAFVISVVCGLGFIFGRGVFGRLDHFAGLATIWTLGAALTGMSLIITALLVERDRAALERLRAEHRYAQIFDGSPQPVWVHDPHTLAFLLVNEAAVRQYGWSREEFLSSRVPMLAPPGASRVLPPPAGEGTEAIPEPFETRHRTRDGRVIEVEVWTRDIDLCGEPAELVFACDVTERRALGSALIDAIANEQRRIGQELHDGLGQELTGLALSARALATRAERERQPIAVGLVQLAALATSCIQAARRIAQGVSPLSDADGDLLVALEALASRSSVGNTVVLFRRRIESPLVLDLEACNHLYRIAQEAVQNALKHAGAHIIEIGLWVHSGGVSLTVNDDGVGLSRAGSNGSGFGMRTMRFRASSIGARLIVGARKGGGVSIACEVVHSQAQAVSA
ncbi:MAG TPA: PAS domain S-box protein [Steroidobacteraceae bacterium]|nr:PAS domain S-box protein [Steroidobacteraceae bacterium]